MNLTATALRCLLKKTRAMRGHSLKFVADFVGTSPTTIRSRERENSTGTHPWIDDGIERYIKQYRWMSDE